MNSKPTLYELLGVPPSAAPVELQAGYRRALQALEALRGELASEQFEERLQVLRLAWTTLRSPTLRASYDTELAAAERAARAAAQTGRLVTQPVSHSGTLGVPDEVPLLKAEAVLARAELERVRARRPSVLPAILSGVGGLTRGAGLLLLIAGLAVALTRCATTEPGRQPMAQARALEQVQLQEYFQTYGVRPASLADLERLEAERRQREAEKRRADGDRRRQEQEQMRWEEEVRRAGETSQLNVARLEQEAQQRAERARELKLRDQQLQQALLAARTDAERRHLELQLQQLREKRAQP